MVAQAFDANWTVRTLGEADLQRVVTTLSSAPLHNVFMISRILDEGFAPPSPFVEVARDGRMVLIASVGSNVVLAADGESSRDVKATAIRFLAERILMSGQPVRAIIADAELVEQLWFRLCSRVDPPTVVRLSQPIYALDRDPSELPDLEQARYSTLDDLDALVPACAAMHLEEVGIDPLARDAAAYRYRVRELISRNRSIVLMQGREIAFKCEYSAITDEAVQLMGVWTAPKFRRQGFARLGMAEVCGHVRRQRRAVTLFVNDFNKPARALYESLGFYEIGTNRALIW